MTRSIAIAFLVAFGALGSAFAAGPRETVEQGKALFGQQKYAEAFDKFHAAAVDVPSTSPEAQLLDFNKAATFYQRKDYKQAVELYEKALLTRDPQVEAAVKYNLGNCYFQKAVLESETDPKTAIEQLDKGMSYYRDAMETLAQPENARYNLEKSKLLKKELIDKAKKQQDEQKKQDQNKDDKKDQKKDDQKKDDQKNDQSKKEDEKKKDEQQKTGGDDKNKQDQQQQQAGKDEQKKEMSPEDAEKLLNAIREKQQQNERDERQRQPAGYAPVDRDW